MFARIRASLDDHDEGFTLVELLVVIIIIGILAAIAIPVFLDQRKKGFQASMKSDLRNIADKEETYFTDFQTYILPTGTGTTAPGAAAGSLTIGTDTLPLSSGNYLLTSGSGSSQFGANGFCLQITSTKSSGSYLVYNSLAGGVQPASTTTCPTTGF